MGSQITREVDSVLYPLRARGRRRGVETFTAQVSLLYLVALKLARIRERMPSGEISFILDKVYDLPKKIDRFLDGDLPIEEIAQRTRTSRSSSISAGTSACRLHSRR